MGLKKKSSNGFTLVEIIIGIAMMGIMSMILAPACAGYINRTKENVCEMNCLEIKKMYDMDLVFKDKEDSYIAFEEFSGHSDEVICPSQGAITYAERKVICDMHVSEKEDEGGAPIL